MNDEQEPPSLVRSTIAAYCSITGALLLVVLIGGWGAYRDLTEVRTSVLRSEAEKLRSHGIRTVGRIENELQRGVATASLSDLQRSRWLERFWSRAIPREDRRLYAAVVDDSGGVIMHSDLELVGRSLGPSWKGHAVTDAGEDVLETKSPVLSRGREAIDVRIPIYVGETEVGAYHSGFARDWYEGEVTAQQSRTLARWALIIGSIVVVVLVAAWSLHRINRRAVALQQAISLARVKQLSDLGRLVGGLAHEIRNPLNAIRLNLHAIEQVIEGEARLERDELRQILEESNAEVARLNELMTTLLGYARPDQSEKEDVDLASELESMSTFLTPVMERDEIRFDLQVPGRAVVARIDRDRFRQIMLNLLNNAREAAGKGGEIQVSLHDRDDEAHITVRDNGRGIPEADREKVFEPFYSTKETGTGLGLALVKAFVEEAGGTAACETNGRAGASFRVVLPRHSAREATTS